MDLPEVGAVVSGNTVSTNGVDSYGGILTVAVGDEDAWSQILEVGFLVYELDGGQEGWEYSNQVYWILPYYNQEGQRVLQIFEMELNADGEWVQVHDAPLPAMAFTNIYTADQPYEFTIEVSFVKTVEQSGTVAPPPTTFGLYGLMLFADDIPDEVPAGISISGNLIPTDGVGVYNGTYVITVTDSLAMETLFSTGLLIVEFEGNAESLDDWKYSDAAYFLSFTYLYDEDEVVTGVQATIFEVLELEVVDDVVTLLEIGDLPVDVMTFVNAYTADALTTPKTGDVASTMIVGATLIAALGAYTVQLSRRRRQDEAI
jgi:hypothetical protein